MAKISITIEGEPNEIRRSLKQLFGRLQRGERGSGRCGSGRHGGRGRHHAESGADWVPWSEEELRQLWGEVTAGARTVLAEIARRPEGYPNAELQQVLGMPGNAIGGTLSSVGVASQRFGPKPPLYVFRWNVYRMPAQVAQVIARLSQEAAGSGQGS